MFWIVNVKVVEEFQITKEQLPFASETHGNINPQTFNSDIMNTSTLHYGLIPTSVR